MRKPGIDHLLEQYLLALNSRDLESFSRLHLNDRRFVHTWSPGRVEHGWDSYRKRLEREFKALPDFSFGLSALSTRILSEGFAVVTGRWSCDFASASPGRGPVSGVVTLVCTLDAEGWRVAADHFSEE